MKKWFSLSDFVAIATTTLQSPAQLWLINNLSFGSLYYLQRTVFIIFWAVSFNSMSPKLASSISLALCFIYLFVSCIEIMMVELLSCFLLIDNICLLRSSFSQYCSIVKGYSSFLDVNFKRKCCLNMSKNLFL